MQALLLILVLLIGEVGATYLFRFIHRRLGPGEEDQKPSLTAILKGITERVVITLFLALHYPHIIIAFAALKLGTRFHDEDSRVSNDYFLIGNLVSLGLTIIYLILFRTLIDYWDIS